MDGNRLVMGLATCLLLWGFLRARVGTADLSVVVAHHGGAGLRAVGILEAPAEVWLSEQDLERVRFLEVRDRDSRAEKRRAADFWPIGLRDRLPVIPVPLRALDESAAVDLQEALHRAYGGPGYEHFIYRGAPEPGLSAIDAGRARGVGRA